jgi:hypothetical protein
MSISSPNGWRSFCKLYNVTCRATSWNLSEIKGHLDRLPYFAQRLANGGKGSGWNHAADVRDVLNCYLASADDVILERHVPAGPFLQVGTM